MTTERDHGTRIVLSWLREDTHENAERMLLRALHEVATTPQRRSLWPAWRNLRMNKLAMTATAAAVLAVAVVGYSLLPGLGILAPGAIPSPSPTLLARGTFDQRDWGLVALEADRQGASVSGSMTIGQGRGSGWPLSVDLRCTRTTRDGLLMIGGYVTARHGAASYPEGTLAAVVLQRGSPVRTAIWVGSVLNYPGTETTECLAYLDAWLLWDEKSVPDRAWLRADSNATVVFGP